MVYGIQYILHGVMSFAEDLKKTKLTDLVDLILTSAEKREELDLYVAKLRGSNRSKLKKSLEKIVSAEPISELVP